MNRFFILALFLPTSLILNAASSHDPQDSSGFVLINKSIPSAVLEIRYFTENNFVGEKVDGYLAPHCYLSKKAATFLGQAQAEANKLGLALKIFDCYRPQTAVNHFIRWAKNTSDTRTKKEYYPNIAKEDLFSKGYIAEKSGHSRGSTIDLTLVDTTTGKELDMGTPYDFLDTLSNTADSRVSDEQRKNRYLLKDIMEGHGFKNYRKEWWHFSLKEEVYPDTYFDFPVE